MVLVVRFRMSLTKDHEIEVVVTFKMNRERRAFPLVVQELGRGQV